MHDFFRVAKENSSIARQTLLLPSQRVECLRTGIRTDVGVGIRRTELALVK